MRVNIKPDSQSKVFLSIWVTPTACVSLYRLLRELLLGIQSTSAITCKETHWKILGAGNRWWLQPKSCCVSGKFDVLLCVLGPSDNTLLTSNRSNWLKTDGKRHCLPGLRWIQGAPFQNLYDHSWNLYSSWFLCFFFNRFVIKTKTKKLTICSNPRETWVQELIQSLDSKMAKRI